MNVHVRFFASLRESLGRDEVRLDLPPTACVADVWNAATGQSALPAGVLCAINHDYAPAGAAVQPGDEVAFFPPVTGG
ncbi:MAG: MoaD/ThiS family protein [Pseudomonadota bacterium]|jgi:molybdopterin synthase sulfur carrier subunit